MMGARSAAFLCQRVTDAVNYMARMENLNILNYLDDLCGVSDKINADEDFSKLSNLLQSLGLREAVEKSVSPSTKVEFLGVLFDSISQTMQVTPDRMVEIKDLVDSWLLKKRATKQELQSLIGKLSFITKCVFGSRIFISRLLFSLHGLKKQNHRFKLGSEFKKDLLWWQQFLNVFNGVTYIPDIIWAEPDKNMSTDECLSGSGGWSGNHYFSQRFPEFVLSQNPHINFLELLSVLVGLRLWATTFKNLRVQIYCDNQASVSIINTGRTRDPNMLRVVREIAYISVTNNFQLRAVHLSSDCNRVADILSRAPANQIPIKDLLEKDWVRCELEEDILKVTDSW